MSRPATNRQKKVLRFFGIEFHPNITSGAARWEVGNIFSDAEKAEKWYKYVYLTGDFGSDSDQLLPYDEDIFEQTTFPDGWSAQKAIQELVEETAAQILASESPFDCPAPDVVFSGHSFCFTGKFDFGPRKECEHLIIEKGGTAAKRVSGNLNFLVIGTQGSPVWKRGSYGNKIQNAVFLRRMNGKPAILSEDHCFSFI